MASTPSPQGSNFSSPQSDAMSKFLKTGPGGMPHFNPDNPPPAVLFPANLFPPNPIVELMNNCAGRSIISTVLGYGMGCALGAFTAGMDANSISPSGQALTVRKAFSDMATRSHSMGKNFAMVGALFAGTECLIEDYRGEHGDNHENGVAAGCVTGGLLGIRGGAQAAIVGCAGFAAFSLVIDSYMKGDFESDPEYTDLKKFQNKT